MKIYKLLIINFIFLTNFIIPSHFEVFDKTASEYLKKSKQVLEKDVREIGDPLSSFALSVKYAENFKKSINQNNYKESANTKYFVDFFEHLISGALKLFLIMSCYDHSDNLENTISTTIDSKYIKNLNNLVLDLYFMDKSFINKCCKNALNRSIDKIESDLKNNGKKFDFNIINKYFKSSFVVQNKAECIKLCLEILKEYMDQNIDGIIHYNSKKFQIHYLKY